MRRLFWYLGLLGSVGVGIWLLTSEGIDSQAVAQTGKSKSSGKANVKTIDVQVGRARESFLRQTVQFARQYEEAGDLEKSKKMLEAALKIDPTLQKVKGRIAELNEEILTSNEFDVEVDVSKGWGAIRGRVFKNRKIRIQAQGTYRFVTTLTVGPAGFPSKNVVKDEMAAGIPCGALMGLIVTKGKPGRPFAIGKSVEMIPKQEGLLFLRVNVPPGHRSLGKISVRLGGYVLPPS